jgi:hypothetical protein
VATSNETLPGLLTAAGREALAAATALAHLDDLRAADRLRRRIAPDLAAAALAQVRLRERAREKFGDEAAVMLFRADALEQATRAPVAALRARRYAGATRVADLGCGLGGDLVPLARTVGPTGLVVGVERDPVLATLAAANLRALVLPGAVVCADVTTVDLAGYDALFCDPARRGPRGRVFDPAAYAPAWPFVARLLAGDAGVKVAPGIPHALLPPHVEAEWVSYAGAVKEAALWSGALACGVSRRATLLPSGATLVPSPGLGPAPVRSPGRFLYEPDGAVIRAGLVAEVAASVDGGLLDPTIAYVTADRLVTTPFARGFAVADVLPFSLKRLRAMLRARNVGAVSVMKRGMGVDVPRLRHDLRLAGSAQATLVLTRVAGAPTVLLVDPVS